MYKYNSTNKLSGKKCSSTSTALTLCWDLGPKIVRAPDKNHHAYHMIVARIVAFTAWLYGDFIVKFLSSRNIYLNNDNTKEDGVWFVWKIIKFTKKLFIYFPWYLHSKFIYMYWTSNMTVNLFHALLHWHEFFFKLSRSQ